MAAIVLVSGGIDSAVLVRELLGSHARVFPAYVREGLIWEDAELAHLQRYLAAIAAPGLEPLKILDLPMGDLLGRHWSLTGHGVPDADSADGSVYLPGRNLGLVAKAAILAAEVGAGTVALGILAGNPFPDATPEFLEAMSRSASLALAWPIRVEAPFGGLSKREVLERGAALPLELTFSCLQPVAERPCGACNKCEERRRAFAGIGRPDPTPYLAGR